MVHEGMGKSWMRWAAAFVLVSWTGCWTSPTEGSSITAPDARATDRSRPQHGPLKVAVLYETMLGPFGDAGADMNGDGRPDIVISNRNLHRDHDPTERANTVDAIDPSRSTQLRQWNGGPGFGYRVAMAGDTNGDGVADVLVTRGDLVDTKLAKVSVLSGASGDTLFSVTGDDIGDDLTRLGDVDGDGDEDFAFTVAAGLTMAKGDYLPSGQFGFEVRSGRDGHVIQRFVRDGFRYLPSFAAVRAFTDEDLDGVPDVLAALPSDVGRNNEADNRVIIVSGSSCKVLAELPSVDVSGEAHESIACAGDIDGNGRADVVVGDAERDLVQVVAPETQRILFSFRGQRGSAFGWAVAGPGDMDGDSVPDIAVGAPLFEGFASNPRAYVKLFSGASGGELATVLGSVEDDASHNFEMPGKPHDFGICVRAAGDINGDGRSDVLVGEDRYFATDYAFADRTVIVGLVPE
jgi:hypothetical protein